MIKVAAALMPARVPTLLPALCCAGLLAGCAAPSLPTSPSHVTDAARVPGAIPAPLQQSAALRAPVAAAKVETYSVTVHKVAVQSLLFALARDAGMNVDIHPGIEGSVTLNALDQTLPQLLTRIARQVDMRFEIDGKNLVVLPDAPVWRNYKVDYVNMARSTSSSVNIATQISTTGSGNSNSNQNPVNQAVGGANQSNSGNQNGNANQGAGTTPNSTGNNNSTTSVWNRSENNFWYSLEKNIRDMLRETTLNDTLDDPMHPGGQASAQPAVQMGQRGNEGAPGQPAPAGAKPAAAREAASVIVNVEAGLIAVRASGRQHQKIQEFLDLVLSSAKRQVLIEATIIEVRLSDEYQQGINWSRLHGGLSLEQKPIGNAALPSGVAPGSSAGTFLASYLNPTSRLGNISATIQLLESFGKVKVLSSPKISVLNNQTALLKVVDNNVFFTIKVTPAVIGSTGTVTTPATYESQLETVPVGFVMSVTPQIAENNEVTLNVRPTITRIVAYVRDPNPALLAGNVISQVPVIQARELESILKVSSGQIAVMGGLMQDSVDNAKDAVPGLGGLPLIGNLFSYRKENSSKTELVIFMRPVVVRDASVNGDYKDYRYLLPDQTPINTQPYLDSKTPLPPVSATQSNGNPGS
ncbi:MAG: pilus (MSHA type) biogenesis protein MshL [Pseudomonadota bacterium]